jgi:hypothetical protein
MMRARILVLTSTFPRWEGDIEPRFVFDLCRYLSKMYEVHILAPHAAGAKLQETLSGISVTRFRYFIPPVQSIAYEGRILTRLQQNPLRVIQVPFFLLGEILAISRLLKTHRFSVIHAHWIIPQGLAAVVATLNRKASPPILVTSHGADIYGLRHPFLGAVEHRKLPDLYRKSTITVIPSIVATSGDQEGLGLVIVEALGCEMPSHCERSSRYSRHN